MKQSVILIFLFLFFTAGSIACLGALNNVVAQEEQPEVLVNSKEAVFTIPVSYKKEWVWYDNGGLLFTWNFRINNGHEIYEVGYWMIQPLGAGKGEQRGTLDQLLQDGQFSVFKLDRKGGGTIVQEIYPKGYTNSNKNQIKIIISGEPAVNKLFSRYPKKCLYTSETLIPETFKLKKFSHFLPIKYQSGTLKKISPM